MFRLIFVTLLSLFSALAWLEAGSPGAQQATLTPAPRLQSGLPHTGPARDRLFVAAESAFLRTDASPVAASLAMLPQGAPVRVVGGVENGYVAVADDEGRQGYIASRLLTQRAPANDGQRPL